MTVHLAKAHIRISGEHLVQQALKKQWEHSLTNKETAPLIARPLLRALNAFGFDARRKRDLEVLELMIRGRLAIGGAAAGDYLEQEVMEHVFRNTAIFTPPANVHIGLTTTATNDTNTGGTEVATGAYARVAVNTTSGWDAPGATGGATANSGAITFPTATGNWGTVSHVIGHDAATLGNRFFHGALTESKTVNTGDDLIIPTGDLDIALA